MARGSSPSGGASGNGGVITEMNGSSGSATNTGKYVIRKRFVVQDESQLTSVPNPPQGFLATAINWTKLEAGLYEKTVDYEYLVPQGSGLMRNEGGVSGRFELDVQDELVPVSSHPNIAELKTKYGGTEDPQTGKVTFKTTYTPTKGSGLAGSGSAKRNPMAGLLYFTKPAASFRHIQQTETIPGDIWNNVGKKVKKLPANFPSPPPFINASGDQVQYYWIVLSPQIYRRGNAYEIVRSYKLSEPGAPDELYPETNASTNEE